MLFREMMDHETSSVYLMGYKEWSNGKSWDAYKIENQKEEETGNRFVLLDDHNNLVGSVMIFRFDELNANLQKPLFGLASIVIEEEKRGMGFGKELVVNSIRYLNESYQNPIILLYSDIDPSFYTKLGFYSIPMYAQHYRQPLCLFYSEAKQTIEWSELKLPKYF